MMRHGVNAQWAGGRPHCPILAPRLACEGSIRPGAASASSASAAFSTSSIHRQGCTPCSSSSGSSTNINSRATAVPAVSSSSSSSSTSSSNANLSPADLPAVPLPQSQAEAISEAVRAVQIRFQPLQATLKSKAVVGKSTSRKKTQGFESPRPSPSPPPPAASSPSSTLAIQVPGADQSAASVAEVSLTVAAQLLRQLQLPASTLTLVLADEAAAAATAALQQQQRKAGSSGSAATSPAGTSKALSLQAACRSSDGLRGAVLLLVEPKVGDVALVEQLLTEVWTGACCVMLNPEFPAAPVPEQYKKVSDSIQVVWSFLPLEISGLLGKMEGAVLRRLTQPDQEEVWTILYKTGDKYVQVGQTKQRPKQDDLELIIMNASAASSPLTKTVKMFKSLMPKFPKLPGKN